MKPVAYFSYGIVVMALFLGCHKGDNTARTDQSPSNDDISIDPVMVTVTRGQFMQEGMQLGGLSNFNTADIITSNGYVDVPVENRSRISSVLGGFVTITDLLPGDRVQKGQVLARLENIEYLKLQQNFLEAREKLVYLKASFEAQSALAQENISSRKNFLHAQAEYLTMQANYESLAKQLKMIKIDPLQLRSDQMESSVSLLAPFDGHITQIYVVNGTFVNPTDVICEVISTKHLHLELKVFEKDVLKLRIGQTIEFRIPEASRDTFGGKVVTIGKEVEGNERTISVHAHIHGERTVNLLPGMYVEARIRTSERSVRGLPSEALLTKDDKNYVLVMKNESADSIFFRKVLVDVGEKHDSWFEIRNPDALEQTGQNILIRGGFNLE